MGTQGTIKGNNSSFFCVVLQTGLSLPILTATIPTLNILLWIMMQSWPHCSVFNLILCTSSLGSSTLTICGLLGNLLNVPKEDLSSPSMRVLDS